MTPYPDQISALNACTKHHRGIVSMPTGTGKSKVIQMIVNAFKLRTLIVVPTLEIKHQIKSLFIGFHHVTVLNIDASELPRHTDYDVLIIDEAHHSAAKTYRRLNKNSWNKIFYRFMFTATPFRNDSEETLLFEAICGQVIFELSYKRAVEMKYIVPVEVYYVESTHIMRPKGYTYREVYDELVVNNEQKNMMIAALLGRLKDKSTLCLVREVKHGNKLASLTGFNFIHGEDDQTRQYIVDFNNRSIKTLIGTTGILGEGIDSRPAEYIIIAGGGKAKSNIMQMIGRGVRNFPGKESCKVILIKDRSHRFLSNHFNAQKKILLDEYGVTPVKLIL